MILALSAAIAGAAALYVLGPLLGWGSDPAYGAAGGPADRRQELFDRKQEALAGLKDLEMEYEMGKLTRDDYQSARERLTRETIDIYREMDRDGSA